MRVILALGSTIFIIESCLFFFTNGSGNIDMYQCNGTECTYFSMAEYATCQNLDLVRIPQHCSSAVYLDFRRNDLQFLDSTSLTGFTKLRFLYLEGNQIRNITPRAFEACGSVQQIFLQNNPIVIIYREVFYGLRDLRQLYLNLAQLEVIQHHAFDNLRSLERLFLSDNRLESLPPGLFHHLSNLQILTLANNRLRSLESGAFRGLQHLNYLDVKQNQLTLLPSGLFDGMISLNTLILSYNAITTIEYLAIKVHDGLNNLEKIDLRNNTITSLRTDSNLERVSQINFAGNPIQCDCHSRWLLRWYQTNQGAPNADGPWAAVTCHSPQPLVGQPLKNLQQDQLVCETESITTTVNYVKPQKALNDFISPPYNEIYRTPAYDPFFDYNEIQESEIIVNPDLIPGDYVIPGDSLPILQTNPAIIQQRVDIYEKNSYTKSPFLWIAIPIVCAFVLILVAILIMVYVYKKGAKNHDIPTDDKKPGPGAQPGPRITENPMPENHREEQFPHYEMVPGTPVQGKRGTLVILRSDRNRSPNDRSNTDSAFIDDLDEYAAPIPTQDMPQQQNQHVPCDSCYVSLQSMRAMHPGVASKQLEHSISIPAYTEENTQYQRPHSQSQPSFHEPFFSPTTPFIAGKPYACIHNGAAQGIQYGCDPIIDPTQKSHTCQQIHSITQPLATQCKSANAGLWLGSREMEHLPSPSFKIPFEKRKNRKLQMFMLV